MKLDPTQSSPWWHHEFSEATNSFRPQIELDRAAILLSAHRSEFVGEPSHVNRTLRQLDAIADRCTRPGLDSWQRLLFVDDGFSGNGIDYHDVRNSFLPDVLDRKVGIPISLSVVGIEVGRRLSLPIFGIGMPGHFLLRFGGTPESDPRDASLRYVDPFHGGVVLDLAGVTDRFTAMFGIRQGFDPEYLQATGPQSILIRMLANLKQNYARIRDVPGLLGVLRLRSCLPDTSLTEGRELVRLLHVTGLAADALTVCVELDQHFPEDAGLIDAERDRIVAEFN